MAAALPLAALALVLAPRAPCAAAAAAGGACPAAAEGGAGLEDSVELVQVSQLVDEGEAQPAAPGWYASDAGKSCTDACDAQGLECVPQDMMDHRLEVNDAAEVAAKFADLGYPGATCTPIKDFESLYFECLPYSTTTGYCRFREGDVEDVPNCGRIVSSVARRLCYCSGPTITTPPPTPAPTVAVTGDPHVTNVDGHRFNLVRAGVHELLRLPRRSGPSGQDSRSGALLEVLGTVESERRCAEPFVRQLDLSGLWLQQSGPLVLRAGGLSEDGEDAIVLQVNGSRVGKDEITRDARLRGVLQVSEPKVKRGKQHGAKVRRDKFFNVQVRLPGATLTVDWVHREVPGSSLNHLDFNVADLPKAMDIGGILGHDDHALAASPAPGCVPTQSLIGLRADSDASTSLLKASYGHE